MKETITKMKRTINNCPDGYTWDEAVREAVWKHCYGLSDYEISLIVNKLEIERDIP